MAHHRVIVNFLVSENVIDDATILLWLVVVVVAHREELDLFHADKHWIPLCVATVVLFAAFIWSYWSTLVWMERQWRTEPDYSHGYLIIPLAFVLLYSRLPRSRAPTP